MAGNSLDLEFQIGGYREVLDAIRATQPDIKKEMDKEIRKNLNKIRDRAKSKYPKGEYVSRINKKSLFGSVGPKPGGVRWEKQALDELPSGVRAAVLEFIGSKYSGERPQVKGLIDSLNNRYGQPGRFLWQSVDEVGDEALAGIRSAVLRAEGQLQAKIDAAGDQY